jgi:hypothetical protein
MKRLNYAPQRFLLVALMRLQAIRTSEQGFIIFFVASVIVLLGFIWAAYGLLNQIDSSSTTASVKSNTGFYAAEYGLNLRAKQIRSKFEGYNLPDGTSPSSWQNCTNSSSPQGNGDFICQTFEVQKQTVSTYVQDKTIPDPDTGLPIIEPVPQGQPFAGLRAQIYKYDVTSVAQDGLFETVQELEDDRKRATASLKMRFSSLLIPLFQFAVFSENDTDASLPPDMNLNGPVHSNSSLYLNAVGADTLTINGQVTVVNTLYRGLKYENACGGNVDIYDPANPRSLDCAGSARRTYAKGDPALGNWNNQIIVGVQKLKVPQPDSLDPVAGKLYWDNADLRVVLKVVDSALSPASPSGSTPISIEIRNSNGSNNATLTNRIQACSPAIGTVVSSASSPPSVTLNSSPTPSLLIAKNAPLRIGSNFDSIVATGVIGPTIQIRKNWTSSPSAGESVSKAILWSSDTFYNYREKFNASTNTYSLSGPNAGRYIRMLNVDMQGLIDCVQSQSLMGAKALDDTTSGGLVWFFTVEGPKSNTNVTTGGIPNNYAIRLYNGASLKSTISGAPAIRGLTVVSDQATYIKGDYNSVDKIPAAVMTDSLNVLSNAWNLDDSNAGRFFAGSSLDLTNTGATINDASECVGPASSIACTAPPGLRTATTTSIHAAFLSGLDIPGGSNGTGSQDNGIATSGFHNYPRFHENWSGVPFNYRGSLVALSVPRRISSPFCGSLYTNETCNIYAPPNRNWDYDMDFNDASKLPPLTPQAVYLQQDAFGRSFTISSVDVYRGLEGFSSLARLGLGLPMIGTVGLDR